jgi:hypothetical protein
VVVRYNTDMRDGPGLGQAAVEHELDTIGGGPVPTTLSADELGDVPFDVNLVSSVSPSIRIMHEETKTAYQKLWALLATHFFSRKNKKK